MSIVEDKKCCSEWDCDFFEDEELFEQEDFEEKDMCDNDYDESWRRRRRRCRVLGQRIARSAVEFEDTIAGLIRCFCKLIWYLIKCGTRRDEVLKAAKLFEEILEQICCIEEQLVKKLRMGLEISGCRRRYCVQEEEEED